MVNYRRNKSGNPDDEYFFTIVTGNRLPHLSEKSERDMVYAAMVYMRKKYRVIYIAWAILPDHIHLLIKSPEADYSRVIWDFKRHITFKFRRIGRISRKDSLWQDRFWESTIRDDGHNNKFVDYIHYNPVKHGLVSAPALWEHSSIHSYIRKGYIPPDWGDGSLTCIEGAEYD
ncbi:MAG: transposase [bacterium]|nr:transposase [bacterium]